MGERRTQGENRAGVETLQDVHLERVRPWLDIVDALRADGVQQDLPLPQIAVMGDQSCGKSSVLESISGVPFPRGTGLTTRCPIQLIMKRAGAGTPWSAHASVTWAHSEQPKGAGQVASPHDLQDVIVQLTSALTAGNPSGFSSDTIVIKIVSPNVPDLTLIDLPGIVRTAVNGQPTSTIAEVNSLITRYINQERTIILAVVPANQDVATVDILERARQVDPEGERTLGVLTKPDLVDEGGEEEMIKVLTNVRAPLKLGYVMVKNRNQREVDKGMDLQEAREEESAFFATSPAFSSAFTSSSPTTIDPTRLGTRNLMDRLTRLLVKRIEVALPGIKWELQTQMEAVERELVPLGKALPLTATERQHGLMKIVSDYGKIIRQATRGDYRDPIMTVNPKLRIYGETHALFATMQESIARTGEIFSDPHFADKVLAQMSVMKGREFPGFLNSQIFYGFMVQNVETWRPSVEVCRLQLVASLRGICTEVIGALAPHLPRLRHAVSTIVANVVERYGDDLTTRLEELFIKESDPYTSNEYMLTVMNQIRCQKFSDAVEEALKASGPKPESLESLRNDVKRRLGDWYMRHHGVNPASTVADMCVLLKAYWQVATKRLVDNVCMTCEKDFIEKAIVEIESECFTIGSAFDGGPTLSELFEEDQGILAKRLVLIAKKDRLTRALAMLRRGKGQLRPLSFDGSLPKNLPGVGSFFEGIERRVRGGVEEFQEEKRPIKSSNDTTSKAAGTKSSMAPQPALTIRVPTVDDGPSASCYQGMPTTPPDLALQRLLLASELSREQEDREAALMKQQHSQPSSASTSPRYYGSNMMKQQQLSSQHHHQHQHQQPPMQHHQHLPDHYYTHHPHNQHHQHHPHHHHPHLPSSPTGKKSKKPEFLVKLYRMLQCEDPTIIGWENGRIHVHDPRVLGTTILHKYFRHSKYSSFQRQLNYFGFRKTQGKGKLSACTYTNFDLTNNASLKSLLKIKRKTNAASKNGGNGHHGGGSGGLGSSGGSIDMYDDAKDTASEDSHEGCSPSVVVEDRLIFLYQMAAAEDEMEQEEDGMMMAGDGDEEEEDNEAMNDEQGSVGRGNDDCSSSGGSNADEEEEEEDRSGYRRWQQQQHRRQQQQQQQQQRQRQQQQTGEEDSEEDY